MVLVGMELILSSNEILTSNGRSSNLRLRQLFFNFYAKIYLELLHGVNNLSNFISLAATWLLLVTSIFINRLYRHYVCVQTTNVAIV